MTYLVNTIADLLFFFFFFQAEDGIRDATVTGVQTCALPISFWSVNPDGPEHTRDSVENTDASASTAAWPTSPPSEWPTSWLNPPRSLLTATRSSPSSSSSYAAGSSGPGV